MSFQITAMLYHCVLCVPVAANFNINNDIVLGN